MISLSLAHPYLLAVFALIAGVVFVILADLSRFRHHVRAIAIGAAIIAMLLLLVPLSTGAPPSIGAFLRIDLLAVFIGMVTLGVALLVLLSAKEHTAFAASVLLSSIGMLLAAAANDVMLLYVSVELATAPTFALVAFHRTALRMEAGVKYFVVSVVSSAIMLFGLALLVSVAGTTSISAMAAGDLFGAGGSSLVLLGMAMTIAGFAFKLGITPSNFWIPDVYQGSPPQVAGFLAGATKKAAYAAFLRLAVVFVAFHAWSLLFAVLAAITMSVPNVIALLQTDVRRTLAYSIMSQAGFLLLGFAAMTQMAGNTLAIGALLFHILTHAVMVMGAFLVLAVYDAHRIESLDQFKGQGYRNPFLGIALTLFLLSLAGIPLLAGFVSKFFLIYAVADAGLLWLGALAIINSVIALYYYFRIIRALWGYPGGGTPYRISRGTFVGIALCLVLTVLIGVWPEKFVDLAMRAAASLG